MALPEAVAERARTRPSPYVPTIEETAIVAPAPKTRRIQLWDWPVRAFHWSLAVAVTTAIVTGKVGGEWMPVHGKAGIAIVGLLAFRLAWGLIGSATARFSHFLPTPGAVVSYLRGQWRGIGHNPLGALSVVALLGVLALQVASGLVGNDDIAFTGPLVSLVSEELSAKVTNWHRQLINVVYLLLGLHLLAIAFYTHVKKDKLVGPMVNGWKEVPANTRQPKRAGLGAFIVAASMGVAAAWGASGIWIKHDAPAAAPVKAAPAAGGGTTATTPSW